MLRDCTDEQLLEALARRRANLAGREQRYGHSNLRSDRELISEANDKVYEVEWELRRRGVAF